MHCQTCSQKPALKFRAFSLLSFSKPPNCSYCGVLIVSKSGHFQCEKCPFSLCPNCKICQNNHLLARNFNIPSLTQPGASFKCNGCQKDKKTDLSLGVFYCTKCAYGVCDECLQGVRTEYPVGFLSQAKRQASPLKLIDTSKMKDHSPKSIKKEPLTPTGLPKKMGQAISKIKIPSVLKKTLASNPIEGFPEFVV